MNSNGEDRVYAKIFTAVFFLGIILNICFAFPILGHSQKITFVQIDNKLNPNTASVYELAELPSIGQKKAQAIVEYRKIAKIKNADDLENVKGIGKKTSEKIKQWLIFEQVN